MIRRRRLPNILFYKFHSTHMSDMINRTLLQYAIKNIGKIQGTLTEVYIGCSTPSESRDYPLSNGINFGPRKFFQNDSDLSLSLSLSLSRTLRSLLDISVHTYILMDVHMLASITFCTKSII